MKMWDLGDYSLENSSILIFCLVDFFATFSISRWNFRGPYHTENFRGTPASATCCMSRSFDLDGVD